MTRKSATMNTPQRTLLSHGSTGTASLKCGALTAPTAYDRAVLGFLRCSPGHRDSRVATGGESAVRVKRQRLEWLRSGKSDGCGSGRAGAVERGRPSMIKRLLVLALALWLVGWAASWLARSLADLLGVALTSNVWIVAVPQAVLVFAAALLVGRWRGLTGRWLYLLSALVIPLTWAALSLTTYVLTVTRVTIPAGLGQLLLALIGLLYALMTVGISWVLMGLRARPVAPPAGAPAE